MKLLSLKRKMLRITVLCMLAAGLCCGCGGSLEESEHIQIDITQEAETDGSLQTSGLQPEAASGVSEQDEQPLFIHVCGHVSAPGVYELAKGSRIYEALEAAGGVTPSGDSDYLNLALELEDGMRLEVPSREETSLWKEQQPAKGTVKSTKEGTPSKVNLNTASKEQLMTLTGIGASRAEAIIRYREDMGGFQSIQEVMKVSGIKENAFEKIKDEITV